MCQMDLIIFLTWSAKISCRPSSKNSKGSFTEKCIFCPPENLVLGMLCYEDKGVCRIAVNKI